ncbi:MAG: methyltransferase domain-containing protein [bacterium]|nr:methyltransferase domain-containing protein [bacterium]
MPLAPSQSLTEHWLFILGRDAILSEAEIMAWLKRKQISYERVSLIQNQYLIIRLDKNFPAHTAILQLGGTIKIAEKISATADADSVAKSLRAEIPVGKIIFSINCHDQNFGLTVKRILKTNGRMARYIQPKNSATVLHNDLVHKGRDLTVINDQVFATRALQPFEAIGDRDYNRPGRDDVSGMLPPKLAMILINLAEQDENSVILDPFCGSGTVITEAALAGYKNIFGTDLSDQAIADSRDNVVWIKARAQDAVTAKISIFKADVTQLSEKIKPSSVDAIITEPYLGKPLTGRETTAEFNAQIKKLKELYLSAFLQFKIVLKSQGVVIFVIPEFSVGQTKMTINCVAEIKNLGFALMPTSPNTEFLLYKRPEQHLGRRIYKFIKNN